ncbi:glycosyltransferase [Actinospica durhamensis]|uniref:Glycosyltransferase n=1 Tax=Actinospica durhamensis TaxID=1508375 RepID=A0A941ISE4_9ACTN|nr:glycosyltransferase family 2 protein [Actinospica durhamensis]MBR7833156.1 glycosyltransferase [Actinospica durhamensis]
MKERQVQGAPKRVAPTPPRPWSSDDATMLLTKWTPPVGFDDEVEQWIPVRGFGAEAGAWTPPPVYADPAAEAKARRDIEDELYRLSGGNVTGFRTTGPIFGPPLKVRYLDQTTMVPALRRRDRLAITLMSVGWMVCFTLFWIWWLSPQNRLGWAGLVINSAILFYVTAIPMYFLLAVAWLRKLDPAIPIPRLRVAFVVTKAPSEPWETAKRTLECMLSQEYPHEYDVWICDERPNEEVISWCEEHDVKISTRFGVETYHRTSWPRRTKCKEGNLAYFYDRVGYADYDVVVQLDCDHVPEPTYLASMVRPFSDPAVGYVAAPSICDANADSSWAARGRLYREAVWHGPVQLGHNGGLAPMCIGSHYAVRTRALRQIGGIGPELAEDFSTTFLLNSAGWQGSFAIDAIAHGDGPMTFADMLTQEFQWSRSLTTLLVRLLNSHLPRMRNTLRTRFGFSLAFYPLNAAVLSAGLLLPPIAVLAGIQWVHVNYPYFVLHVASVSIWLLLLVGLLRRRGLLRPAKAPVLSWENWMFTLTGWPYVARGVTAGFMSAIRPKPITFKVTPKSAAGMPTLPARLMTPYLAFSLALSGVAVYGELCTQSVGYVLLCIFSSTAYATISIGVPLLHARESARNAGETFRRALSVARTALVLGLLVLPSLGFAMARYVPYVLGVYHR